jgi:hypothetical protein
MQQVDGENLGHAETLRVHLGLFQNAGDGWS